MCGDVMHVDIRHRENKYFSDKSILYLCVVDVVFKDIFLSKNCGWRKHFSYGCIWLYP